MRAIAPLLSATALRRGNAAISPAVFLGQFVCSAGSRDLAPHDPVVSGLVLSFGPAHCLAARSTEDAYFRPRTRFQRPTRRF